MRDNGFRNGFFPSPALWHLKYLLCTALCVLFPVTCCTASEKYSSDPGEFTFYTRPEVVKVYLVMGETTGGEEGTFVGFSGTPCRLDREAIRSWPRIILIFRQEGFMERKEFVDSGEFLKSNRFPAQGAISLNSACHYVTFLTQPEGASLYLRVVSHPEKDGFIGLSGAPINWDCSSFNRDETMELRLKLWGYKEGMIKFRNSDFNLDMSTIVWPLNHRPERLTPVVPLVIPFIYWVKQNHILFSCLVLFAGYSLFRFVPPYMKRMRQQKALGKLLNMKVGPDGVDDSIIGRMIGRYRILEKVGAGGMARVYKAATDSGMVKGEFVAIKFLQADLLADNEFCRRFQREIQISSMLNHPHIVRTLDYGDHEGVFYLVMELVEGENLRQKIPAAGFDMQEFLKIYMQIIKALIYAHDKGIVHRDLKPENIMLEPGGHVVVMDFGLARGKAYTAITLSGTALGTPLYMSPEQISGKPIDGRSDQYALGAIAFHMLTGNVPFWDENTVNIIFKHISEPPPPIRTVRPDLPEAVEKMILRMLDKEPEMRFSSLKEVLQALENIKRSAP